MINFFYIGLFVHLYVSMLLLCLLLLGYEYVVIVKFIFLVFVANISKQPPVCRENNNYNLRIELP